MVRQVRGKAFRDDQWELRYTDPGATTIRFIDDLSGKDEAGRLPYIPPMYRE